METKFTVKNLHDALDHLPINPVDCLVKIDNYRSYEIKFLCVSKCKKEPLEPSTVLLTDDLSAFAEAHDFYDSESANREFDFYDCDGNKVDIRPYVGD